MNKSKVMEIENFARNLMSGMNIKSKKISIIYYYILEDTNYHALNNKLTKNGNYGKFRMSRYPTTIIYSPSTYGSNYAERLYKDYRKSGGRTWEL